MIALVPLTEFKPHKLTVDSVLALERSGALGGQCRMELLDGILYEMSPQTSRHVVAKNELGFRLKVALLEKRSPLSVLIEPTVRIGDTSAPEPDIAILTDLRVADYYPAHMIKLIAEIAVSSLETDLRYKKALYAAAGIAEYWVIEVDAGRIHQFWQPQGETYREARIVAFGPPLSSMTIAGLTVETAGII